MSWGLDRTNFDRNIAVVIGINNYQNGIHPLKTAVNDARAIADLLEQEYKYQKVIRLFPPYGEATWEELNNLLSTTLPEGIKLTDGDRLLFYFAGHGIARNSEDGPAGALIPQDAKLGEWETYLPMKKLNEALSQLKCHHLLVILDCCFAGNFRWSSSRNVIPVPETIHREHYDRFIRCRAWQAITSAAHNQEAIDFLSDLRDGANNSHHSPFALALIEGLKDIKADLTGDGVITAPELYLYLRDRLLSKDGYSELQTPGLWPLQKHDRGEFIFTLPGFTPEQLKPAPPLNEDNNPYRGLQPYDEKHARFFFGRQELIEELYNKISTSAQSSSQLVAVLGISGSGKSSLVKAGLIPYLRKNHEKEWQILEPMRPGKSPFIALASTISAIANVPSDATSKYIKHLIRGLKKGECQQLIDAIAAWSQANPQVKLLLTIDQFEELITMSRKPTSANSEAESDSIKQKAQNWLSKVFRRQPKLKNNNQTKYKDEVKQEWQLFLNLLTNTLKNCPQLHIVLTLRSDFEARFVESALKEYWEQARFPVRAMRSDELREAIEKPASEMALYFEPANAVDRLIDEVGEMPGALPLLSFTLSEFYIKLHQAWIKQGKEDRALTVDEQFYQQGGIAGSLTYRANQIYDGLPGNAHRDTMRRVMLRMVGIQGGEAVRRQVPESELVYSNWQENERVNTVIKSLINARLIVKGKETGEPYVEPAHDFLVRGWDKLQEWSKQEEENLPLQRRLTPAAVEWKNKQESRFLWNADPYLDVLKQVLKSEKNNWFNRVESEFVQHSVKKKRQNTIIRWSIAVSVILGSFIFSAAIWLQLQRTELQEKAARVDNLLATDNPVNGLVLAIQATGQNLSLLKLPWERMLNPVQSSLLNALDIVRERNILRGHQSAVRSVAFSPDGQTIVSGGDDRTVRLWDSKGNLIGSSWHGDKSEISSVAFSPNRQRIISASYDGTVRLWDSKGNPIGSPWRVPQPAVRSVAFSPDGQTIVSGGDDMTVRLWDSKGNPIGSPWRGHQGAVRSVAFSPDGQTIVSGGEDGMVRLWDSKGNIIGFSKRGHEGLVFSVGFSPDGQTIVSGGEDGMIRLWDSKSNPIGSPWRGHQTYVTSVAFSPNGQRVVSGGTDRTVRLWDSKGNPIGSPWRGHQGDVNSVAFSPDGQRIISGSEDGTVRLWDTKGNIIGFSKRGHEGGALSVAFSPDGQRIVSGGFDTMVRLWDSNGNPIGSPWRGHQGYVRSVAFSPNGQRILSGGDDKTIRLWDSNGNPIGSAWYGHEGAVNSVSFSPDGQRVVSGGDDRTVRLWNSSGNPIGSPWRGHQGYVWSVAFSSDGQKIISSSLDQTVRLWDKDGNVIGSPWRGEQGRVHSVAFSPDGQKSVTIGDDGALHLWTGGNWKSGLQVACDRLRDHPVLVEKTEEARGAKETCQRYVWSQGDFSIK